MDFEGILDSKNSVFVESDEPYISIQGENIMANQSRTQTRLKTSQIFAGRSIIQGA